MHDKSHLQGRCISGHGTAQSRSEAGEESLEAAAGIHRADGAADGGLARCTLQTGLDGVDGEDGNPHGNTGTTTSSQNGRQGQFAGDVTLCILGGQRTLDILVGGEVGSRSRAVAGQRHGAAAEDAAKTALLVQLAHDVHAARVLGFFTRGQCFLALDLQEDLDTLEGCGNQSHGDGREETSCRDLCNGILGRGVLHWNGGGLVHNGFAQVVGLVGVRIAKTGKS